MSNPVHDSYDEHFRGRYVRATSHEGETLEGWVERIHHHDRHVVLRDARDPVSGEDHGAALLSHVDSMTVIEETDQRVEPIRIDAIHPAPWSAGDWDTSDNRQYIEEVRDQGFVGSYPVVRPISGDLEHPGSEGFEIVEGHKRIWVCEQAGLTTHPVVIVDIDNWAAAQRFVADHFPAEWNTENDSRTPGAYDDAQIQEAIQSLVGIWGTDAREFDLVDYHMDRLDLGVEGLSAKPIADVDEPDGASDEEVAEEVDEFETEDDDPEDVPDDDRTDEADDDEELPEFEDLVDEDADDDSSEETSDSEAAAEPTDECGVFPARTYGISLTGAVPDHFDTERVTVRETDTGAELVPGTDAEGPDYAVSPEKIQLGNPGRRAIGAERDEEIRAIPDGETVRLEVVDEDSEDDPDDGDDEAADDVEPDQEDSDEDQQEPTEEPHPEPESEAEQPDDGEDSDEETELQYWCGYCGKGPKPYADNIRDHHDREDHPGEPVIMSQDPAESDLLENGGPDIDDDRPSRERVVDYLLEHVHEDDQYFRPEDIAIGIDAGGNDVVDVLGQLAQDQSAPVDVRSVGISGEKWRVKPATPDGLTEGDVHSVAGFCDTLEDVAEDMEVTVERARAVLKGHGCLDEVVEEEVVVADD